MAPSPPHSPPPAGIVGHFIRTALAQYGATVSRRAESVKIALRLPLFALDTLFLLHPANDPVVFLLLAIFSVPMPDPCGVTDPHALKDAVSAQVFKPVFTSTSPVKGTGVFPLLASPALLESCPPRGFLTLYLSLFHARKSIECCDVCQIFSQNPLGCSLAIPF
jgi:hypothetical protein